MEAHPDHETAKKDRVALSERIGLGFGKGVAEGTHGSLNVLANPIYNIVLGLDPFAVSTVVFIQRLFSAMCDPFFGQFSDNFRSRWGRRRPLILLGALPVGLLFAELWWFPRHASNTYLFWHLLVVSILFYAANSFFAMPVGGLIVEATDDYHERTRIAGFTLAFGFAASVGSQWLFPLAQNQRLFPDVVTGIRWVGLWTGLFFALCGLAPAFMCRERFYKKISKQKQVGILESLRMARENKSFMALLWARCLFSFGYNIVGIVAVYMVTYYVFNGDVRAAATPYAILGSSYQVSAIICSLFVYPRLEKKIGKRRALEFAGYVLVADCISRIFLFQPGHPWLAAAVIMMNGMANAGVSLMCVAMLGDIADYDEWKTGLRREGIFNSLLSWFEKAGNSMGSFLTGLVLNCIGFNAKRIQVEMRLDPLLGVSFYAAKYGAQTGRTLLLMKASYVVFPFLGAIFTVIFARRYKLTQDEVYRIKAELAARRAGRSME